jgi:hypothetical protein
MEGTRAVQISVLHQLAHRHNLLLTAFQTCDVTHEIHWLRLACIAYSQLWLARRLVDALPLPWQRYLPQARTRRLTPRQVQRGFVTLIAVCKLVK